MRITPRTLGRVLFGAALGALLSTSIAYASLTSNSTTMRVTGSNWWYWLALNLTSGATTGEGTSSFTNSFSFNTSSTPTWYGVFIYDGGLARESWSFYNNPVVP